MAGVNARVEKIVKTYNKVKALDNVTLEFEKGRITTLLGPSGCGKTTLLKIIAGIEKPDKGKVYFDGIDVTRLPPEKRNIGFVFQDLALFPHMTVFDNIAFGLRIRKIPKQEIKRRVYEIMELVGLDPQVFGNRKISQLSGGQRQRVAIARALVIEPNLLLLDEPFAHLDYKIKQRLLLELRRIQKKTGVTVVYVTHDQEEAMTVSHRIAIMRDGKIVQVGSPREVYENPNSLFVATFFGDANIIPDNMSNDKKFFIIRPEYVRLDKPGRGKVKGVVTDVVFKGIFYKIEIKVNGYKIKAILSKDTDPPVPGSIVGVSWDSRYARVVNE